VTGANQVREDRRNRHEEKVSAPKVVTTLEATESPLPPQIQEALGELVGAAREGLLALSVGVGLGVVHELMELEVVRHEALSDRAGCETSPPGCRSSLVKLGAVRAWSCG
jgi:hypothetical protein